MKKFIAIVLAVISLAGCFAGSVSAMTPYITYTYSIDGNILESPDAYVPDLTVDSEYMGLTNSLVDVRDVEVDDEMNVYIVDAGSNRVVVLDRYYKVKAEITEFVNEQGVPDTFNNPSGIFVADDYIYICDTSNSRIVMLNRDFTYHRTVQQPSSTLFETDDIYSPIAVAVDKYGRMFIVSSTTYQGIIVMDEFDNFYGFIGAQAATVSALELIWRKFMTAEQLAVSEQIVSTEYNNIEIDDNDMVYATISSIDESTLEGVIRNKDKSSTYAPVKKLNANGNDVMIRNGFYPPAGEVKMEGSKAETSGPSRIIDSAVGPHGTWSIIDEKRSKIFTYNESGELLFAFGDNSGSQTGNVKSVEAITYQGDKMVVLDKGNTCLVVYRRTEYGDILMQAIIDQDEMRFDAAADNWEQILKRNNNFDLAYIGIGKYYNWDNDFETAMKYFKAAHDTALYSDSYNEIRNVWMNKWFWTIPVAIVVGLWLFSKFLGYAAKINTRAVAKPGRKSFKEELYYILHLVFHPFDGFWDLKHERRGSVRAGVVIVIFTILAFFYQSIGTGYIFTGSDASYDTIFSSILSVVVPVALWVVSNWCLTTLLEGEGSLKDVFVATAYSISPLGVVIFITTICSNFMVAGEAQILSLATTAAFAWCAFLLFFGTMVTHGYSFGKNVVTVILTIVAMAFLMFLALLFSSLIGKVVSFIAGIIVEVNYRI
ncbi:MAG: YIP1 family protein [Clostridia bacterium]|nr:YIP1 family protein [Clostridia bacterium]